jgi:Spy/CpxP family protein refolding chaperone
MLVVFNLLSCSAAAFGQMPPGPPGMRPPAGGGPDFNHGPPGSLPLVMLAMQKSVQGELKLDKTQKQRLQELDVKLRKATAGRMPPPGFSNMAGRPELPNDSSAGDRLPPPHGSNAGGRPRPLDRSMEKEEKELVEILSAKQLARLRQIALQFEGPRALLAPERVKELELTEKQQEKIRRLTRNDARSVSGVLNAEQQAKWREMTGRPFRGKIAFPPPTMPMPRNERQTVQEAL